MNVQVLADPAGRLISASPALPGTRHDMGAAREHGILDALTAANVRVIADNGYRGSGFTVSQRRRPADPETGQRSLSGNQKAVNSAHARQHGPGERANALLESSKILRKIRCCPHRADLVKAVVLIHAGNRADKDLGAEPVVLVAAGAIAGSRALTAGGLLPPTNGIAASGRP